MSIGKTTIYRITTGNLFGISMGWVDAFEAKAKEIIEAFGADYDDLQSGCNPAFAGAWVDVFDEHVADAIEAEWKRMLPLALRTMSPRWRADYDKEVYA